MANEPYFKNYRYLAFLKQNAAWRFADTKAVVADLKPSEGATYLTALDYPKGMTAGCGTSGTRLQKRRTVKDVPGKFATKSDLNTARLLEWVGFTCATTEANPDIHNFTLDTDGTPNNKGVHVEFENPTDAESRRYDLFGFIGNSLRWEASEQSQLFQQIYDAQFAIAIAADDLAEPTALDAAAIAGMTHYPYMWKDFSAPTFTYNSETQEVDILGFAFNVQNNGNYIGNFDSNGYAQKAIYAGSIDITCEMHIRPYGKNIFEVNETDLELYITDFDLTWRVYKSANQYIQSAHDKMELDKIKYATPDDGMEEYKITLKQLSTGSVTIQEKNELDNDYYENP